MSSDLDQLPPEFESKTPREEAIRRASELMRAKADLVDGIDAVRFISPARLYKDWLASGIPASEIPAGFRTSPDHWAVVFKRKERMDPGSIIVRVDDSTGEASLVHHP